MAIELMLVAQVRPASAIPRNEADDVPYLLAPLLWKVVKHITLSSPRCKFLECFPNRSLPASAAAERNLRLKSSDEYEPAPALRHGVVGGVEHIMIAVVTKFFKRTNHFNDAPVICESGHVLHHHSLWAQSPHELQKLKHEIVARVLLSVATIERGHLREALTRRAPREQIELSGKKFQPAHDPGGSHFADVIRPYDDSLVVGLVGCDREGVVFHRPDDAEASLLQSKRQAAAAGEQVDGNKFLHASKS